MLLFTETGSDLTDHAWKVNQPKPLFGGGCVEVKASGAELTHIRNQFDNLPFPAGATRVVWKGDLAQFIYDNLPDQSQDS
jgi:hypothetical protein